MTATYAEQLHDLEVQIRRHREEIRLAQKETNDALIAVERANAERDEALAAKAEAEKKQDAALAQTKELSMVVEDAQTAHAAAKDKAAKHASRAADAKDNLAAEREARKALEAHVEGLEKVVARLESQLAEAQPKLDALAVLNLNI